MSGLDAASWNVETSSHLLDTMVFGEELAALADARDDLVVLTADLMTSNRTDEFQRRHPDRYVNVGIAEQNMMGIAAGLASCGYVPYVSTFAAFASLLCAEHLRTDFAYTRLPVRVLAHHAGISMGFYGTSHHAVEDIAITRSISHFTVVAPCDAWSTRAILRATVDEPGPVYVRLGRGRERAVYEAAPAFERGRFVRVREGRDVTIIATGIGVRAALDAAALLADADGIEARVEDAACLKPLDDDAVLAAAADTGAVVTVEEHNVVGGLGTAVAEVIARNGIATRLAFHGLPDDFALVAPPTHLYRHYGLTAAGVAERVRGVLA
jgi:transketolase